MPPDQSARICYPYHPHFGQEVTVVRMYRRVAGSDVFVELDNGRRFGLPTWMLDENICQDKQRTDRASRKAVSNSVSRLAFAHDRDLHVLGLLWKRH
jgi:hypothetical protein